MESTSEPFNKVPVPSSPPSLRLRFLRPLMRLSRFMQGRFDMTRPQGILHFRRISEWMANRLMRPPRAINLQAQLMDGVRCEWLNPPDVDPDGPCLVFLHGGGMVFGYGGPHRRLLGNLALDSGLPVLAVDYSLAPESTYPTAHDECWSVYQALSKTGQKFILVGESSGGVLALATMLRARHAGLSQPIICGLISPMVDLKVDISGLKTRDDPFVDPYFATGLQKFYFGEYSGTNMDLSPIEANLAGLAPMLIMVAEQEILRGESERLLFATGEAGVDCRVIDWPHVWHGWHILVGELPEARQAMRSFAIEIKTGVIGRF